MKWLIDKNKIGIILLLFLLSSVFAGCGVPVSDLQERDDITDYVAEKLDRGIYAFCTESGVFISWRVCTDDDIASTVKLYRDEKLICRGSLFETSCYVDALGSRSSVYKLEVIHDENTETNVFSACDCNGFYDIRLDKPRAGYLPGDCSIGDADGDGSYELFLKWEAETKDPSQDGNTDTTFIDCIKLDGTRLWRIDLGINIRSGQHYTPMSVADFDCDGCAELIVKTADGTVDGTGQVIGNPNASYTNGKGRILEGDEYLTLFDGCTGQAVDTIGFPVERGDLRSWGDADGNRCDRFNGGAAYLDGVHPSAIFGRGYYKRLSVFAVDVFQKKLVVRWIFDTGDDDANPAYGCGNHSFMAADVDGDDKQEICLGTSCIDNDGTLKWSTGFGHGDALHVGCFLSNSNDVQVYTCLEEEPYGVMLLDGETGNLLFSVSGDKDTGRCVADDLYAGNSGAEFLLAGQNGMFDQTGKQIGKIKTQKNFLIYWDGDVFRELLDDKYISKVTWPSKQKLIFTADGCVSINGTKANPCLTADILGDWREELILPVEDGSALRVWCTTKPTEVSMVTLMQDPQYRMQVACEQSCYNQPPHAGFNMTSERCRSLRKYMTLIK